jgi:serine protease Do
MKIVNWTKVGWGAKVGWVELASPTTLLACLVAALLPLQASAADDPPDPEETAFRTAADRVAPCVVRIETIGGLEQVGRVLMGAAPTSGLVVGQDGYIVSSAFGFANKPDSILVQLADGTRKPARVVAADRNRMIVLLKIDPEKPLPVPEAAPAGDLKVGQWTIAVGRGFDAAEPNIAVGVLSAVNRIWGKAIQTDAAVSPSNYGGPLVDLQGRVLGILAPLSPEEGDEMAGMQWYDSGIGFAVPLVDILATLPELKKGKDLLPGATGLRFASRALHIAEPVIAGARANSPAYKAGLKKGDRIEKIGDRPITLASQVKEEISRRYAGQKLTMTVGRDGKSRQVEVELADKLEPYVRPFLGVLPMRVAANDKNKGVPVRYVYSQGPADKAGIQPGDVITSAAGRPLADARELVSRIAELKPEAKLALEVRRGDSVKKLEAALGTLPEEVPGGPLPAAAETNAAAAPTAKTGVVKLSAGAFANEVWACVPASYNPAVPQGLLLWLHGPGEKDVKRIAERWKPACDASGLIFVIPKATADHWRGTDLELIRTLTSQIKAAYTIDPARVVIGGDDLGGTLAYVAAFSNSGAYPGVATVNAVMACRPPECEPDARLAFFVARPSGDPLGERIDISVHLLRELNHPVTVKDLGQQKRPLSGEEMEELARWIDTLDRI